MMHAFLLLFLCVQNVRMKLLMCINSHLTIFKNYIAELRVYLFIQRYFSIAYEYNFISYVTRLKVRITTFLFELGH